MVHVYSVGYMHHDRPCRGSCAYLSLFTFCMLMLVTADNLVQMFFGWEGVGLASYLLIGFWYKNPSATQPRSRRLSSTGSAISALRLGIFAIFLLFDSSFDTIFAPCPDIADHRAARVSAWTSCTDRICLLLFVGAMGKSAQMGLHTWLPDAMEGPTPVSALIHAATMVTAGVFMVARLSPMFEYSESP